MSARYRHWLDQLAAMAVGAALLLTPSVEAAAGAQSQPQSTRSTEAVPPMKSGLYRLAQGDVIDVRLFYNPELNEQVQIRPDGHISLSLLGDLDVAGKTIPEAVAMLEPMFAAQLRSPQVVIQVRSFAGQKVFVTGEVVRPGIINLPGTMTVLDAISEAGGIKTTGNRNMVVLIRKGEDGLPKGYRLVLSDRGAPAAQASTILGPFDVVMVPESKITRVDRWVDQYIRQLVPFSMTAGFAYIVGTQTVAGSTVVPVLK